MSSPMILNRTNSIHRRKLLLHHGRTSSMDSFIATTPRRNTNARFGEVCGSTAADVAAVCCCCPCGLANLVVLAVYKVPAGLCRRAMRHRRLRKLHAKGLFKPKSHSTDFRCDDGYFQLDDLEETEESREVVLELDNEMWQQFYGTGFWRSPSFNGGASPSPRFQVQPL